jgi:hypothetical protein
MMFGDRRRATCQALAVEPVGMLAALVAAQLSGCGPVGGDPVQTETVLNRTEQSAHFVFHYAPGDSVDVPHTEAFYAWISEQLSVDVETRIQYYKFKDRQQKLELTGYDGNGIALPSINTVYTIWPWESHEVTHLLTYRIGAPAALFVEGIAVATSTDPLDGFYTPHWNRMPVHRCAKDFLSAGKLPSLAGIVETDAFRYADPDITYPTAGSFVEYLIEQYGIQKVLHLFPGASSQDSLAVASARFQQVFGISLETAEQDWLTFLRSTTDFGV